MSPMRKWSSVIALLLLVGCRSELDLAGAEVALEREPAGLHAADFRHYEVRIAEDGAFTFTAHGLDGLDRTRTGQIPADLLREFFELALELDFFELQPSHGWPMSDEVPVTLEFALAGRRARVVNHCPVETLDVLAEIGIRATAEEFEIPSRLTHLASSIDAAVGSRPLLAEVIAEEAGR